MAVLGEAFQARDGRFLPLGEELGDGVVERGELGVAEDGGLQPGAGELELKISGAAWSAGALWRRRLGFLEQRGADTGNDLPVGIERIDVAFRDATVQMGINVLKVLRLGAVDIAGKVEVVVVLRVGDFADGYKPSIAR